MSKFTIDFAAMVWNLKPFVWFADTWEKAGDAIREAFYHRVIYGTQKYDCWYFSVMLQGFDTVFQNWRQIFYPSKLFWPTVFLVLNFILQKNMTTVIYKSLSFFSHFSFRNFLLIKDGEKMDKRIDLILPTSTYFTDSYTMSRNQ